MAVFNFIPLFYQCSGILNNYLFLILYQCHSMVSILLSHHTPCIGGEVRVIGVRCNLWWLKPISKPCKDYKVIFVWHTWNLSGMVDILSGSPDGLQKCFTTVSCTTLSNQLSSENNNQQIFSGLTSFLSFILQIIGHYWQSSLQMKYQLLRAPGE